MKSPLTPAGIEPATYPFVAEHINHCATAVPVQHVTVLNTVGSCNTVVSIIFVIPCVLILG